MIKRELEFESLAQKMGCYVCGPLATLSLLKLAQVRQLAVAAVEVNLQRDFPDCHVIFL